MAADTPIVLVVRHPDHANEIHTDGDVTVIDIDLGSSFDGKPTDPGEAEEWAEGIAYQLDGVPTSSPVFTQAVEVYRDTVARFPAAAAHVEAYVKRRREA